MSEVVTQMVYCAQITVPELLLREGQTENEQYLILKGSINTSGIRNPLLVSPGTAEGTYILSDGMQRLTIAKELGLEQVPIRCEEMSRSTALLAQIEMNAARVDVTPTQYSKFLQDFAKTFPNCTVPELAAKIHQTAQWVRDRLKFDKLSPTIKTAVDEGQIPMSKAIMLVGMDNDIQEQFVSDAMSLDQSAFATKVSEVKKEIAKAKREGRTPALNEYIHEYHSRPKADIVEELSSLKTFAVIGAACSTPQEGYALALRWAVKDDDASREAGKARWEEAQKLQAEKLARKQAERDAKQAAAAAAAADATGAATGAEGTRG